MGHKSDTQSDPNRMPNPEIRDTKLGHSRSIADICEIYSTRKNEGKIRKATIASYALPIRIFKEFFSPKKALSTLTFDGVNLPSR